VVASLSSPVCDFSVFQGEVKEDEEKRKEEGGGRIIRRRQQHQQQHKQFAEKILHKNHKQSSYVLGKYI
jgi:hypothetical protein